MAKAVEKSNTKYGPWDPGIESSIPAKLLPSSTMFREDNVATGFAEAHELAEFCGLQARDIVVFRPERLLVHELLVRVTADLSVPDGPEYEELGINLRSMTQAIYDNHVVPVLEDLRRLHSNLQERALDFISSELAISTRAPAQKPVSKSSIIARIFNKKAVDERVEAADPMVALSKRRASHEEPFQIECGAALSRVVESIIKHRGKLIGDHKIIAKLAAGLVVNDMGSRLLGDALDPIIKSAVVKEGYRALPSQSKPVVMNVKGASASGKSTIRPLQRKLAEDLGVPWDDFALISPDYWRKYLLDYESLGEDHKYGAMLTGHELAIIDQKLDRYMAEKARAGTVPHMLIDRFRFDSFSVDESDETGGNLLTRFGSLIFMYFMITPPRETVERAWKRGLETGRFKAVDDLLDHNVEAYNGMPEMFFSLALSENRRVHSELLDNDVPLGDRPKTVAFGWNGEINIVDINSLLNIHRFTRVNIDATSPDGVFQNQPLQAEENTGFLEDCIARLPIVNFLDQTTGACFGRMQEGNWVWQDLDHTKGHACEESILAGLKALGWFDQLEPEQDTNPGQQFAEPDTGVLLGKFPL